MCGFFISNSNILDKSHKTIVQNCLGFRGPDFDSDFQLHNGWWSYHSRLSIIGLNAYANQPVRNTDGSQLVFNGEILNYVSLGKKYFNKIYKSDTLLLNDLILFGLLKLIELDGFFSFIFIDGAGKIRYAARDRFGVKPLYYRKENQEITFASEPSAIKSIHNCKVNDAAIQEYKAFRAPLFQGSFFEGVREVKPGTCLVHGEYFNLESEIREIATCKQPQELQKALVDGINSRMVADTNVALLLSSGVDSNLLKYLSPIKKFYSVGFDGDTDIEYLSSQNIENLTCLRVTSEEFRNAFEHLLTLRQEPMSVPNEVLLYLIAQKAKQDGFKVLFSGEGADEFFAGYDRIFGWAKNASSFCTEKFLNLYAYTPVGKNSDIFKTLDNIFNHLSFVSPFDITRWFFIKYHLPILFRRLDFSLMAAGVEGREPIANQHVFREAIKYTAENLMTSNLGKKPLRAILAEYTSHEFAFSEKVGFPVNLQNIFPELSDRKSYEIWFHKNLEVLK